MELKGSVCNAEARQSAKGLKYVTFMLRTNTENVRCIVWDTDKLPPLHVKVSGKLSPYKGEPNFVVFEIAPLPGTVELRDGADAILNRFRAISADAIGFIEYVEGKTGRDFSTAPGGRRIHHAFPGGLIQHSVEVAEHVIHMADIYHVDDRTRKLAITGALIHDVGKLDEITEDYERVETSKFYGNNSSSHIYIGAGYLSSYNAENHIEDYDILQNIILSHHGPYGSVAPTTLPAIMVHQGDMISSRMNPIIDTFFEHLDIFKNKEMEVWKV